MIVTHSAFIFGCSFQFCALIFVFDYNFAIDVLQLGHVTINFLKILYIMRYNLKDAKNGMSISKILKWPSLMSLALKSKLISQFEFFRKFHLWKIFGRARPCTPTTLFIQIFLVFFLIQTVIKSHSLIPGASNFVVLMFSTSCLSNSGHAMT